MRCSGTNGGGSTNGGLWTLERSGSLSALAKPLDGIRVVEIGHSVAAPYAGMILGELGADVIKVENPHGGDYARAWGPPFSANSAASAFEAVNRAKRGAAIDLADPAGQARLRSLVETDCDVLIHNLKFGAMERLGLAADRLLTANPRLVYCCLGAFGAAGPLRERPGYDPLMQAFGGLMSVLGEEGRPPVRVGVSIVDLSTGMWSVIGILAALQRRAHTRRGGRVDTSLYESALAWMTVPIAAYLCSGDVPQKVGSGAAQIVPYQAFATSDGHVMVAAGNDNLFRRLAGAVGRAELADDPRFRVNADRVRNRAALVGILEAEFARASAAEWGRKVASGWGALRPHPDRRPGRGTRTDQGAGHDPGSAGRRVCPGRPAAEFRRRAPGVRAPSANARRA